MTLNIIDVSRYQSMEEMNALPTTGLDGIITCVTFGINGENPIWRDQHQWAKDHNLLFGGYHIRNGSGPTPQQEADFYLNAVKDIQAEIFVPALDWEQCDESQVGWASEWLDIVNASIKRMPLTYLNQEELDAYDWDIVANKSSLWVAQYDYSTPLQGFQDLKPLYNATYPHNGARKAWPVVAMWQYASTVYFGSDGPFDANLAYMDKAAWQKYGSPTGAPSPAPNPQPAPAPAPKPAPAPAPVSPSGPTQCIVESGDTLWSIAQQFGTTVNAILAVNNIPNPNLIYVGQVLNLPSHGTGVSGTVVVVAAGDTLSGIAARYGTTWQALASFNGIANPNVIYPGQQIRIP